MKTDTLFSDEKHLEIIQGARKTFMTLGVKSVTMDDVARNIGISKKTLYKYVKDKTDLLVQTMKGFQQFELELIMGVINQKLNAIDENFEISKIVVSHLSEVHPSVMFDLQKFHPSVMKVFESYKEETIHGWLIDNMERGMKEGYYRSDLNTEIIAKYYIAQMDFCFNGDLFPRSKYSMKEIYLEMFRYHIRGIASEKGVKFLADKIKREKQVS